MKIVTRIAREEWRIMSRNRVAMSGLLLLTLLTLMAILSAFEHQRHTSTERTHYQTLANQAFENQPDRHPHRVAHYGHFLFRPLNALAAFDPGIDAYTGNTMFLEAHRQNSANFGDVRQSSLLLRFGQLTPAFVLQVLAPLLLIFVGHAAITRERESGTLRVLLSQGIHGHQLVIGKVIALSGFAGLALLPAILALGWLGASTAAAWPLALGLLIGYTLWMLIWLLAVVLASTQFVRGRDALLVLLATWTVLVILVPRWAPDISNTLIPLPTRFENAIHIERDYQALGDSHNPNDPKFKAFQAQILKEYGVRQIKDLPVNFKGLVGMEGERQSSELFQRYAHAIFEQQAKQSRIVDAFGWLSPTLALRRLSMTLSGTDLANFRRFLEQGENYRYDLIQRLNRLQTEEIHYGDDTNPHRENRLSHTHWQAFPEFSYVPAPLAQTLQQAALASGVLLLWALILGCFTHMAAVRLERNIR